jgi:PAS domain S-box-containing protein
MASSGEPAASRRFALAQSPGGKHGMVVYQALYDTAEGRDPRDVAARQRLFRGAVFVTMRIDELLAGTGSAEAEALQWCLVEIDGPDARVPLAGEACVAPPGGTLASRRRLDFAGRTLELGVVAVPEARVLMPPNAWLLSVAGMCSAALLGALLLTMSGHALRVEQAVDERTALLQREVLERQQAERARREGEERLRSILDHAAIGVMFFDQHGRVVEANPHLAELLGRTVDELQRSAVPDFLDPDEVAACRERLAELQAGHADEVRAQVRMRRADGEPLWVLMRVSALRGATEQPQRFVGLVEDHSDRMRLEQAERERERAEAANRAKSDFVSRMSHELRTPLNAMLGFAQILALDREPGLAPQQREWVMQIQRAGWHLLEMINETLDLARIEAGAVRLALGRVDVAPMLAASAALVDASARQRGVTVAIAASAGIGVIADEMRLKQVLTNLLSNAIKYNREGGAVTVSAALDDTGHVAIAVADTGLGMTPEQMGALFQPYNRLGREHTAIEGTGIGLVISRRLAELMNGTLEVSSRAGHGSTFTLRLAAAAPEGAAEPASPARAEHGRDYHRRIVHYIEDNETNVELMRGVLAQRSQVELAVSTNGLDGLAALRLQRPDLILLDMHLPDISGLELLRHLKRDDDVADIPVIVVSADATTARMQEALTLGALHYVTKPLDIPRFLRTVDEVLQSQETRWGV